MPIECIYGCNAAHLALGLEAFTSLDGCPNHYQTSDRMSALQLQPGKAAMPALADNRVGRGAVKRPTLQG